jgi:Fe-S cluster assembly protein SufD
MQGRGAQATCRGLYILDEQQQMVVNSQQEHGAAETTTDIVFKGILSGQARAFFKGTIVVTEQGKKSNAVLYNKNILASTQARVVSMPQLEVAMNDVQCKHGSAISHVDKHQMLYLQSRGLDAQSAQTLLLASFVSDCIDLAYVPHVQKKLQAIVQEV